MALTITSPGVQINETDLSLRTLPPQGSNVLVPGFAPQGPTAEPLVITTVSELETVYGTPTTPAERYFYYSCREVLNSPATLTTIRLPYGENTGSDFALSYSGLFYPMTSAAPTLSSEATWTIGAPIHISLTPEQYSDILEGNIEWLGTSGEGSNIASVDLSGTTIGFEAGFVVLNDLQTTVNEVAEGFYVGFADNLSVSLDSLNFDSIKNIVSLSANDSFAAVSTSRLDFALSATTEESSQGVTSVSERLEKVGFVGFESSQYQDHLSLGVFRIRKSTADGTLLSIGATESYIGSFDANRKQVSPAGGILGNAFIEDIINNASPTIKVFVNPAISEAFNWTADSTLPTARVTVDESAKSLFPVGIYTPNSRLLEETKIIGSVPAKLDKALRMVENPETVALDVVIDAGLSTVYATAFSKNTPSFNDTVAVTINSTYKQAWAQVGVTLINFAENVRKDCVSVLDIPRHVVVSGKDKKTIDSINKTFTEDIYKPLKELAGSFETNYAAIYGNWVKVTDIFTGRSSWIPFSGYAGAIFARNDFVANPWSAPGGLTRGTFNAVDIAMNPNQKQRDRLYEISVNPVVFFAGEGFAVMGQKTMQKKPTAFDRLNVRRLFLSLERAVQRTVKYFVFEPNTEFTRTRIRTAITPIFEFAKNTEGLYDYQIIVDERNNTPETIDNNQLIVDIYIKPVRTAEFILINFIATRTSQNFQELI